MKNRYSRFSFVHLLLAVVAVLVVFADPSQANNINFFTNSPTTGGTNLAAGIGSIIEWVYWIFYLLGAVFMGVGAFKLKQGDMGGFGKNMAGGATLFFVPAAIKLFRYIGENAV
jgi:hypothetical protein